MAEEKVSREKVKFLASINNRLNLSISLIVIALMYFALFFVKNSVKNGLIEYFEKQMAVKKEQLIREIENQRVQMGNEAAFLASDISGENWDVFSSGTASFYTILNNMKEQFGSDGYVILDRDYMTVADNLNYEIKVSAPIQDQVLKGNDYRGYVKLGADIFILCGSPIKNLSGNIVSAVYAIKKLSNEVFLKEITHLTSCEFTIFDGYKRYVTSLDGMQGTKIDDTGIIDKAAYGEDYTGILKINGTEYLCIYTPFKDIDNQTLTVMFLGTEVTVIRHVLVLILGKVVPSIAILAVLVIIALYFLTLKPYLGKPLKTLKKAVGSLNTDEADLTLRLPVNEKRGSEFDLICSDINAFIERLYVIVNQLVQAQDKLLSVVDSLTSNSQDSASAIAQIMANIDGVRHQSENQAASVNSTSVILTESGEEVKKLAGLIDAENQGINNSSASIEEMLANIRSVSQNIVKLASGLSELSDRVGDGQRKLEQVSKSVLQIEAQSASLNDANSIISQISSQTNLLAMNAAIEAAHAGDAGKGFSVVADEIRKLAEDSASQTKKIAQDLKDIKNTISTVVTDTQESAKSFNQIVENITYTNSLMSEISSSMTEQEEASKQVFDSLSDMKNHSAEVDAKSKRLEEGVVRVASEMENVTQISETILGSMDEMTSGAGNINESAQNVQHLAQTTKEITGAIDSLLKQFKINQ